MDTSFFSVTDLFAGAGGSSSGLVGAGIEVVLAANHNRVALETHAANHPDTRHDFCDLTLRDPAHYPRTTMLWASPACTNHSAARGKKVKNLAQIDMFMGVQEATESEEYRSRALMNDVLRFVNYHRYEIVVVENVSEVRFWGGYESWKTVFRNFGYELEEVYLNSMHVGVPQSRDRIYICAWKKGNRKPDLALRPVAHCPRCDKDVRSVWAKKNPNKALPGRVQYGKQYVFVCPSCAKPVEPVVQPASSVIDWQRAATRIGDRKKELSPNTMRRIAKGLEKYLGANFTMDTLHSFEVSDNSHLRSADMALPTLTTAQSLAVVQPFIVSCYGRDSAHSPVSSPLPTLTTINNQQSLCIPPAAFIAPYYGTDDSADVREPMPTLTTKAHHGLVRLGETPAIEDCLYRMLTVHECMLGMSFPETYILCGTSEEVKMRQVGNAVTPSAAQWLGQQMFASLEAA